MTLKAVPRTQDEQLSGAQRLLTLCSDYALTLMRERTGNQEYTRRPSGISLRVASELETAVGVICAAHRNIVSLEYSLQDMHDSLASKPDNVTQRDFLLQHFPPPFQQGAGGQAHLVEEPTMILDTAEKLAFCYLPDVFTERRKEIVWSIFRQASDANRPIMLAGSQNWRGDKVFFKDALDSLIRPGVVNISPCWFPQGHSRNPECKPGPSSTFGAFDGTGGQALISDLQETNAIIGAVFSLLHPDAFNRQVNAHERVYNNHCQTSDGIRTNLAFRDWSSPFNGIAFLCNRESPFHRDMSGGPLMFDFLSTFGRYRDGRFEVPVLGARFPYDSGTGIFLPGYLYEHGAAGVEGDRICLASFIRPEVGRYVYSKAGEEKWVDEGPPCHRWLTYHWGYEVSALLQAVVEDERKHIPERF